MTTQRLKRGYDTLDEVIVSAKQRAKTQCRTQHIYLIADRHVISAIEHPGALAKVRFDGTVERIETGQEKLA